MSSIRRMGTSSSKAVASLEHLFTNALKLNRIIASSCDYLPPSQGDSESQNPPLKTKSSKTLTNIKLL